jgi:hypothetical protein
MKATNTAHLAVGIAVLPWTGLAWSTPFDKNHAWQKISFHITSPNNAAGNTLRIVPAGLQIDNSPIEMNIDGMVTGTVVADLNSDRSPEVYIYVRLPGAANRLALVAFSANNRKSLSGVHLPELDEASAASKGYCGNDQMALVKGKFVRRFPLCDGQGQATGKTRQIEYKLQPGEAGWQLKLHSVTTVVE